jgi:hypothetical protein
MITAGQVRAAPALLGLDQREPAEPAVRPAQKPSKQGPPLP